MNEEQKKKTDAGETGAEQRSNVSWWQEIVQLLRKNRKSLALVIAVAVVLLGVGMFLGALIGQRDTAQQTAAETQTGETGAQDGQETEIAEVPLEENAYPEINALIEQYYEAAAAGDIDTINSIKDYSEQTELLQIQEKSKYLEGYEDINCYTKPGPEEGTYVVYASYYAKFRDIDRTVCGLNTFVVCQNSDGEYYIHDCSQDEAMREYRINVTKQDDVVELFNRVQVEYNEAVTEDEELAAFLTQLSEELKVAVGDALAEAETETAQETVDSAQPETETAEEETVQETAEENGSSLVAATEVVNIRSSDSETADVLGKAQAGETFTLLESRENGWSRIAYNDGEAYIKSEFLVAVEESEPAAEETQETESQEADAEESSAPEEGDMSTAGEASDGASLSDVPNSGTYRLTTTVNIRSSASESADRIAVGYSGDEVEILMKQADGWTRVRFNGEIGYIRTDVLR